MMLFPEPTRKPKRKPRARYGYCKECQTRTGVPVEAMCNGYMPPESGPPANLACAACGQGWYADPDEHDRAV